MESWQRNIRYGMEFFIQKYNINPVQLLSKYDKNNCISFLKEKISHK